MSVKQKTKEKLIVTQYESFTSNERKREATVLQFIALIIAIVAGFGYLIVDKSASHYIIAGYSLISFCVLWWITSYILNSTYQFRSQQLIQSKIREEFELFGWIIPHSWNNLDNTDKYLWTNYYFAHLVIIGIITFVSVMMPFLYSLSKQRFLAYSTIIYLVTGILFLHSYIFYLYCFRFRKYKKGLKKLRNELKPKK